MSSTLDEPRDDTIETTGHWPEGLDFKFPRRDLGRGRWLLLALIFGVGALVCRLVAVPIWQLVRGGVRVGDIFSLVGGLLVSVPLCRYALWYPLALLLGQREIGLRSDWLYAGERRRLAAAEQTLASAADQADPNRRLAPECNVRE